MSRSFIYKGKEDIIDGGKVACRAKWMEVVVMYEGIPGNHMLLKDFLWVAAHIFVTIEPTLERGQYPL